MTTEPEFTETALAAWNRLSATARPWPLA